MRRFSRLLVPKHVSANAHMKEIRYCNTVSVENTASTAAKQAPHTKIESPETQVPWKDNYTRVPKLYWTQVSNRRFYFDWLFQQLGLKTMEDWYSVTSAQIREFHRGPLHMFGDKLYDALIDAYPEHKFLVWRFSYVPRSFWRSRENQRAVLDWIGDQLGVQKFDDWYYVTLEQISAHRGARLIALHGDSLSATLRALYPEHTWKEWLFESKTTKSAFFKSIENQREYVKWLEELLQIPGLEGWYNVDQQVITSSRLKGTGWLERHGRSLQKALIAVYPDHEWLAWRFNNGVEEGFWQNLQNRHRFVHWIEKQLALNSKEDWYRVRMADLKRIGAWGVFGGGRSWVDVVTAAYPDHSWDKEKFGS